jgi:hypothetical protein
MVYKTDLLTDCTHRPVSYIDHDVSETGSVTVPSGGCSGVKPIQLDPVERANLDRFDDRD